MNKIKKNILVIIAIVVLIISGVLYIYLGNKEQENIETGFVQGKIAYQDIKDYKDGIMLAKKDDIYKIIDIDDKVIEKLDEEATDITILYDGYYTYKLNDKIYLNRNGKNVHTFDSLFEEDLVLYKDENDEKAEYIYLNPKLIKDDIYYTSLKTDTETKSIVYNAKTGKILYEVDDYISLLSLPNQEEYEYFVVGDKELVQISDFKSVFKETDINIVSDETRLNVEDDIISNNSKYLVISSNTNDTTRYGLIDLQGNIVIPISYEDIHFQADTTKYIAAKKDGKYGLISTLNEELLAFNYDAIEVYNNNIVLVNNNRLGIMDNELNLIYNYKLSLASKEYDSRSCCGNNNAFEVSDTQDNLIINTYPVKNEEQNDEITFSNTIIVNKQNEITELKKQTIKYIYDDDQIINSKYLIKENIDDKTLSLTIYDASGDELSSYETVTQEKINSVTYELYNEDYILVSLLNEKLDTLYQAIIDVNSGKVLYEEEEIKNYIKKQILVDSYYFYGENNKITIKDANDKTIMDLEGKDIKYLRGNYYAVKLLDNKYYICQILLEDEKSD